MTMFPSLKFAAASLMLASLAACATPFRADVSRFENRLPAPQGQTFAVVAEDPALAGGLEFSQYAHFVEAQLGELGYVAAASPADATLLVRFDYAVDEGRERVQSSGFGYGDPFYSPWMSYSRPVLFRDGAGNARIAYLPNHAWGYGYRDSFFGGYDRGVESYTVFTSGERLFEGRAEALSTSNRLQYLVPNLVEAMFTDFPGNSGETVRISVAPEDQPVRRGRR